jgi:uncharacterized repeat protein (TIGR02059 family)
LRRLLIIIFILTDTIVSGTNYYVKNGGNDSSSGLSDGEAWANHPWMSTWKGTITLKPGDIVFMKRGDSWSFSSPSSAFLIVGQNGVSGNLITTTSYGTSDKKPVLQFTGNYPFPVISGIGKSYIAFNDIEIKHFSSLPSSLSEQNGIVFGKDRFGNISHDWTITNCEIHECPFTGIYVERDAYNIIIGDINSRKTATRTDYSNHIYNCGYGGVVMNGSDPVSGNSNYYVSYNYIHDINVNGPDDSISYGITFNTFSALCGYLKNAYATYNFVENVPTWTGIDCHNGQYIYFQNNYLYNCKYIFGCQSNMTLPVPILDNLYIENNIGENPGNFKFQRCFFAHIHGYSPAYPATNVNLSNNKYSYTDRPEEQSTAYAIKFENINKLTIEGNFIFNGPLSSSYGALQIYNNNSNVVIRKNYIKDWSGAILLYASNSNGNIDIYNNIINVPEHGIWDESTGSISGNLNIYNNVILVDPDNEYSPPIRLNNVTIPSSYAIRIKNNIIGFLNEHSISYVYSPNNIFGQFDIDYNLYFNSTKYAPFYFQDIDRTKDFWLNRGYDINSVINSSPEFTNYSGSFSVETDFSLDKTSPAINKGTDIGLISDFIGNPIVGLPDIGAFEYKNVEAQIPVLLNSAIENASPSKLDLTFNLALANIIPSVSAFAVRVNSNTRSVSSVSVSGTKVSLTLSSAVTYGDVVTVAYSKPATNPLQTTEGGQAASFPAQTVSNKIVAPAPAVPTFVSSSVENAIPSKLDITYSLSLANIIPATSAFTVSINSNSRSVSSVAVSGTKVSLTLSAAVAYGDVVTVAYTKPSTNPLQTTEGGQAASFSSQVVTNKVAAPAPTPATPTYVSSSVENATPSKLDIVFNLSLANIVPATSAFTVTVNSGTRSVSSIAVSGTKLTLTLSSPVIYGDAITVAYTKPSANPLQTSEGGQAASFTAKTVSNKLSAPPPAPAIPVYVSSSVENATPTKIDINFNLALASTVPSASAFMVMVNSTSKAVTSVAVSGTKVTLTLSSTITYGNVITVTYTKPPTNPLQTSTGGQVASFSAQPVSNKVGAINNTPVLVVNAPNNIYSGFVNELNATGSYDKDKDNLSFTWTVPSNVPVSSTTGPIVKFLGPVVSTPTPVEFMLKISDGKTTVSKNVPVEILPYKPELEAAEIANIEASSYYLQNYPHNIIDGNIGTMWSASGVDQWLIIEMKESFNVQHVKLAFQPGQKNESYFDILGSTDKVMWEPILIKSASCGFSGDLQVFDFPPAKAEKEFKYVKMIGLGNSADTWNYISELKIYGYRHNNPPYFENLQVKLYPNPAYGFVNIRIDEPNLSCNFIKIINLSGKIVYQDILDNSLREFQIPLSVREGLYLVQLGSDNVTLFTSKLVVSPR